MDPLPANNPLFPSHEPPVANVPADPAIQPIAEALRAAARVLICTHRNPDGDAIGSTIAMVLALEEMKKDVYGYCPGAYLKHFLELPHIEKLHSTPPENRPFDLTLILDCGDLDRVTPQFKPIGYAVNIDHHATNPLYGDLNWVDPTAAATGEMVYTLIEALGVKLSSGMAQAIYLAIMTDTGSFHFSNTQPRTFALAGLLLQDGADPAEAAHLYWDNVAPESLRLRGEALARLELSTDGRVAWSQLTAAQIASHGGVMNEPEGLSNQLRGLQGVEVGVLFTEVIGEGTRVSMRSHGGLDVSEVAREFGGGGHRAAAGAIVPGDLETVRKEVLEAVQRALAAIKQ